MFNLDIDERKRYNRVVLIAFLIGAVIYSLLGYIGTQPEVWVELEYEVIQLPNGDYFVSEIEPFPWWFPLFGFLGGGWLIGGVAGGTWFSWKIIRRKMTENRTPIAVLMILSPFLLWFTVVVGMMPGVIIGIPYAIYNVFVIRKYNKVRSAGEMSILEMNIYGKKNAFMHQLFKEHSFDENLFEQYFDELKILRFRNERKEMLKLVVRRNDEIINTINNHFVPDNPLVIKNMPINISDYTERIHLENQRLIKML